MKRTISLLLLMAIFFSSILTACTTADNGNETTVSSVISENESSDDPENSSEESKDMSKEPISTEYINAALGKFYQRSALFPEDGTPSYPDENGKTMTDGVIVPQGASFGDPAFMGFNQNATAYRTNSYATITVDLEKIYSLDKFVAHVGTAALGGGIDAPEFVWIYVSADYNEWYEAGRTNHTDTTETNSVAATLELEEPVTARYVQFRFMGNSNWIFVSEVEAYGREAESAIPYPRVEDLKSFLFVGNSSTFYFNTAFKFKCLAESLGVNVDVSTCCYGGAYLYEYADPDHKPHGDTFRNKIAEKKYDFVVLQDNSGSNFETAKSAVDVLLPMIEENGAEMALYMRYSSSDDPDARINSAKRHYNTYTQLAAEYGVDKVAAAADAFLICTEKYPEINLYFTDNSHHNSTAAYLIACVMAIEYLGLDVTKATYTAGLDEDTAGKLWDCAKIACTEGYDYPN